MDRKYGEVARIAMHELLNLGRMTAHGLHSQVLGRVPEDLDHNSRSVLCMLTEIMLNGNLVWCSERALDADEAVGEKYPERWKATSSCPPLRRASASRAAALLRFRRTTTTKTFGIPANRRCTTSSARRRSTERWNRPSK